MSGLPSLNACIRCSYQYTSIIVSIPVDVTGEEEYAKLEEKGVHGHYVSVERIKELDNGKVEWRLATSSRAEGNIPQFMTERSMASSISRVRVYSSYFFVI